MPDPAVPAHPSAASAAGAFALGVIIAALATVTRADADLWGHVRFGLDLLRTHHLTAVDPYSFTQDRPWINHEWLSELQMGAAYALGGTPGLVALKVLLLTSTFAVMWSAIGQVALRARLVVLLVVVLGTFHMTSSLRPQLWTFLCLALLCRALAGGRSRQLFALPLLFAFWANCHGGWIVGAGVLVAWASGEVTAARGKGAVRWAVVVAAALAGTLATPYGWRLWAFIIETVHVQRAISEWEPLWTTPVLNWTPWATAVAGIVFAAIARPASALSRVLVLAMLAYGAARVMRIESLFVLAAGMLSAPALQTRWPRQWLPLSPSQNRAVAAAACALALVPVVILARRDFAPVRCIGIWGDKTPDEAAMRSLRAAKAGRLVTFFDWGEYAIWHLGPRLKVSMDGRRETVYSDARIAEHDAVMAGSEGGAAVLARWRPEYVWLPATSGTTKAWLAGHGYRLDVVTPRSFVAVRDDLPRLPGPGVSASVTRCFPE